MANRAVERARELVEANGLVAPISIESVAEELGLRLVKQDFDQSVSAMLHRYPNGDAVIGINSAHPATRQRFSIAHEIGHYLLHPGRPLIVDGVRVSFRNEDSSTATQPEEIEANQFAAELLMPSDQVKAHAYHDFADEDSEVKELARVFKVSRDAMRFRLINLGLHSGA